MFLKSNQNPFEGIKRIDPLCYFVLLWVTLTILIKCINVKLGINSICSEDLAIETNWTGIKW